MTVGGSTIGSVTRASITGAKRVRVALSQRASGSPNTPNSNVVTPASLRVSQRASQSGGESSQVLVMRVGTKTELKAPHCRDQGTR